MPSITIQPPDVENPTTTTVRREFPFPRFVVTIYSPSIVEVSVDDDYAKVWKPHRVPRSSLETTKATRIMKIKMSTLIVKMINKLIKDEIIPAEAVNASVLSGSMVFVQILLSTAALPVVLNRCEFIGVGNSIGTVFSSPIESAALPPTGAVREIVLNNNNAAVSAVGPASLGGCNDEIKEEENEHDEDVGVESVSSLLDDNDEVKDPAVKTVDSGNLRRLADLKVAVKHARKEWLETASRVRVEQVVEEVTANAALTYDYLVFTFCAAWIAALGLMSDNSTTVVASMLVSPILGPVMGITFGWTIRSFRLVRCSFRNECISLLICVVMGAFMVSIFASIDSPSLSNWPSKQITSRGDVTGLALGVLVAIPSGLAVSLGILGRNSSGLVGVAISLSLLPPAVNAGICWAYSLMLNSGSITRVDGDETRYWEVGAISFALTMVNIICIWLAGTFAFWLKEIVPLKRKNAFWSRDVKVFRNQGSVHQANLDVIHEGIRAAVELQDVAGPSMMTRSNTSESTHRKMTEARRRRISVGPIDYAFALDNDFGLMSKEFASDYDLDVVGKARSKSRFSSPRGNKGSLWQTASTFGGLEGAGEALFNDALFEVGESHTIGSDDLLRDDRLIHEDVADYVKNQSL